MKQLPIGHVFALNEKIRVEIEELFEVKTEDD